MITRPTPFDSDDALRPAPLSAAGRARRDAMLTELQGAVVGAARRRRALRAAAIIAPPALAVAVALAFLTPSSGTGVPPVFPTESPAVQWHRRPACVPNDQSPAYTMKHADFQIIDAAPSARIVTDAPGRGARVRTISDDELLEALRATGRDVGLIRTGRRVILTDNRPDDDADRPSSRRDRERRGPVGATAV